MTTKPVTSLLVALALLSGQMSALAGPPDPKVETRTAPVAAPTPREPTFAKKHPGWTAVGVGVATIVTAVLINQVTGGTNPSPVAGNPTKPAGAGGVRQQEYLRRNGEYTGPNSAPAR